MKYIFFGTPEFAYTILKRVIEAGMPPVAVVCNPDKPVGRKKVITPPLTKVLAEEHGIQVYQPATKKELVALAPTLAEQADFGVVAAYAKIIPQEVIEQFRLGIVGVHPSLLPRHRGPSPIQSAILAGDSTTGTTLFMLTAGVDDGPILAQRSQPVLDKYYEPLMYDLAELSAEALVDILPRFSKGEVNPQSQQGEATYTQMFDTDDARLDFAELEKAMAGDDEAAAREIERMVRALNPEPGVFTHLDGKRTKILRARVEGGKLVLEEVQKEGKQPQPFTGQI